MLAHHHPRVGMARKKPWVKNRKKGRFFIGFFQPHPLAFSNPSHTVPRYHASKKCDRNIRRDIRLPLEVCLLNLVRKILIPQKVIPRYRSYSYFPS